MRTATIQGRCSWDGSARTGAATSGPSAHQRTASPWKPRPRGRLRSLAAAPESDAAGHSFRPATDQNRVERYNDLDLAIMGLIRPEDAYPDQQGQVHWIEPRLTTPLSFRAGLLVAFQIGLVNPENPPERVANDFIFFGLSQDHRRLAVERTDGSVLAEAQLGAGLPSHSAPAITAWPFESSAVTRCCGATPA
jgi:hypothetical protein